MRSTATRSLPPVLSSYVPRLRASRHRFAVVARHAAVALIRRRRRRFACRRRSTSRKRSPASSRSRSAATPSRVRRSVVLVFPLGDAANHPSSRSPVPTATDRAVSTAVAARRSWRTATAPDGHRSTRRPTFLYTGAARSAHRPGDHARCCVTAWNTRWRAHIGTSGRSPSCCSTSTVSVRINDAFGYAVGDRVLAVVAARLAATLRGGDTAARLGADEFALLLEDMADESNFVQVSERVSEALSRPITVGRPCASPSRLHRHRAGDTGRRRRLAASQRRCGARGRKAARPRSVRGLLRSDSCDARRSRRPRGGVPRCRRDRSSSRSSISRS